MTTLTRLGSAAARVGLITYDNIQAVTAAPSRPADEAVVDEASAGTGSSATRALAAVTGVGAAALIALVIASGRAPTPVGVTLERGFLGLLHPSAGSGTTSAVIVVLSLAVLVACWWQVLRMAVQRRVSLRAVGWTGAAWLAPVLMAPPLLSLDAYAYLAQGTMVAQGLDPYGGGPVLLGDDPAVGRVDPMWRASPVPYGPLTLLLLRAVALAGADVTTGVLLIRVLALLGVAAAIGAALRLASADRRPYVLTLCALNPITLVHLVGGAHIDAVLAGVIALSLLALRQGRPWLSWLLAGAAVAVKITAGPLLIFVLVALWRRGEPRRRLMVWGTGIAVLPYLASLGALDRPWGFVAALMVPGSVAPWYAPASLAGGLLTGGNTLLALPVGDDTLRGLARLAVLLVGVVVVLRLVHQEYVDSGAGLSRRTIQRVAVALLVVPFCLPALYGWYLAAGLFLIAAVGTAAWTSVAVLASSALTFSSMTPLYAAGRWSIAGAWVVALALLAVSAVYDVDPGGVSKRSLLIGRPAAAKDVAAKTAHKAYLRLAQVAGVGLIVPAAVGLLSPGASADVAGEQARSEGERVVRQLTADYPGLQVVSVLPTSAPGAAYEVEMVQPGRRTCELVLGRGTGPRSRFSRLEHVPAQPTLRAAFVRSCPLPVAPAGPVAMGGAGGGLPARLGAQPDSRRSVPTTPDRAAHSYRD